MPDGVETHALSRSLQAMTFGVVRAYDRVKRDELVNGLGQIDHQFQVPISGHAGGSVAWSPLEVAFAAPMVEARDERQSPYADPLFTFGVVVKKGPPALVTCAVRRWVEDSGYYSGAVLDVGVVRPGATDVTFFSGEVHLNFSGWGAPTSDYDDGGDEG